MLKIEIFKRTYIFSKPRFYFRIKASNGRIIAQSEGYNTRIECRMTASLIINEASTATIETLD